MKTKKQLDRGRERRKERRILDVGLGKKKFSDAAIEEVVEETFDWIDRGGVVRILNVLKWTIGAFALFIAIMLGWVL